MSFYRVQQIFEIILYKNKSLYYLIFEVYKRTTLFVGIVYILLATAIHNANCSLPESFSFCKLSKANMI